MAAPSEIDQLLVWLQEVPLFADLDEALCAEICAGAQRRRYPQGSTLIAQESEAIEAFLILSGSASILRAADRPSSRTMRLAQPGDLLGEMGLICLQKRSATVLAHEDCEVLVITQAAFHRLLRQHPDFALGVMAGLCRRIIDGNRAWELARAYGTDARIASVLLDLFDRFPVSEGDRHFIGVRLTHADLAAMLSVARENVTKSLARFRRSGAINATRGRIEMVDPEALRSWIC
ncbi:MAG: CRP/FNR family cyclic AMP-dependent transcriptional regulator [Rhodothermales bacterium]|jgi:CRP/FNR family cyclic AMP-dependent transcriptional regulator